MCADKCGLVNFIEIKFVFHRDRQAAELFGQRIFIRICVQGISARQTNQKCQNSQRRCYRRMSERLKNSRDKTDGIL